ncbi:hypothetical protein GW17_00006549 [Ensete ventricosum]|nr:hypothetical protein GW17_00006549 [Ensete ventricosum]RZS08552.1 hypothetical protein BHM03_00039540 [Ensete ventricosum]
MVSVFGISTAVFRHNRGRRAGAADGAWRIPASRVPCCSAQNVARASCWHPPPTRSLLMLSCSLEASELRRRKPGEGVALPRTLHWSREGEEEGLTPEAGRGWQPCHAGSDVASLQNVMDDGIAGIAISARLLLYQLVDE